MCLCHLSNVKMLSDPVMQSASLSSRGQHKIFCADQADDDSTSVPTLVLHLLPTPNNGCFSYTTPLHHFHFISEQEKVEWYKFAAVG